MLRRLESQGQIETMDRGYLCCFEGIHVKTGAFIINSLYSFTVAILVVQTVFSNERRIIDVVLLLIQAGIVVAAFIAVLTRNQLLLIPSIIYSVILSIALMCAIVVAFFYAFHPESLGLKVYVSDNDQESAQQQQDSQMVRGVVMAGVLMLSVLLAVNLWFVEIQSKCYLYFKNRRRHNQYTAAVSNKF